MNNKSILIVDDEKSIVDMLEVVLNKEGFNKIYKVYNAEDALKAFDNYTIDLVLLDIMLPDSDGIEVCKKLRENSNIPIVFLSAKNEELDIVLGITIGGDDYITKPFSPKEVATRIKAIFRREYMTKNSLKKNPMILRFENIIINKDRATVTKKDKNIILTSKEYNLLVYMAENHNILLSKDKLIEKIWGDLYQGMDNTLMVHISRVRDKIEEDSTNPKIIKTYKKKGYKFVAEVDYE